MKFLAVILLFGLAYAYVEEGFVVSDGDYPSYAEEIHEDMKTELGNKIKDALNHVLQDIKDALQRGKNVSQDLIDEVKKNLDKLKKLGVELEDKTKNLLQDVRERVKSWWKDVLDKLTVHNQTHYARDFDVVSNCKHLP
ncbi:uncharacterized protein PF3D7_1120000-like [Centruroides vittatus]|uniref:uncharacterized protein PF3D7_1120000-like n=1 Tax=Centruroides vittatus TaxID=120091 RepID=UPI00350EC932